MQDEGIGQDDRIETMIEMIHDAQIAMNARAAHVIAIMNSAMSVAEIVDITTGVGATILETKIRKEIMNTQRLTNHSTHTNHKNIFQKQRLSLILMIIVLSLINLLLWRWRHCQKKPLIPLQRQK